MEPNKLAEDIRDIYLMLGKNWTMYQSLALFSGRDVSFPDIIPEDRIKEFEDDLAKLYRVRKERQENCLGFSDIFDFNRDNQKVEQIRYCQDLMVKKVRELEGRVVSIGIGNGVTAEGYAKGRDVTGIDLHKKYLDEAKKRIPSLKTLTADLNKDTVDIQTDIIECTMVGHHLADLDRMLTMVKAKHLVFVDLVDKGITENDMIFKEIHRHPPFHGIEFFRSHEEVRQTVEKHFKIQDYVRVGPGILYLHAS